MDAGRLLRAVRRARVLSQRELAAAADVPSTTVDRIESGATQPRLRTVVTILRAAGYRLVVADEDGNVLELDDEHDRLRDRGWRRFPAHLPVAPVTGEGDGWWGWRRIAWLPDDKRVPEATYVMRPRRRADRYRADVYRDLGDNGGPYYDVRRWDDAT